MSSDLLSHPETGVGKGHGIVEVFDADKLRFAIASGKLAEHEYVDGKATFGNLRKMVALRHLDRRTLRHPLAARKALSVESQARPSMWVPAHVLKRLQLVPDEVLDAGYNLFLTAGVRRLWDNLNVIPGATGVFDATHCRIGTGDGATAVTAADTTLTGSTNKWFQILDSAPTNSTNQRVAVATTPTGQGNFVWAKWGQDNGTASAGTAASAAIETAPLFNAAVSALGTKTSAAAWAFTVTTSIS